MKDLTKRIIAASILLIIILLAQFFLLLYFREDPSITNRLNKLEHRQSGLNLHSHLLEGKKALGIEITK